jgi:hypothetical protein
MHSFEFYSPKMPSFPVWSSMYNSKPLPKQKYYSDFPLIVYALLFSACSDQWIFTAVSLLSGLHF